MKSILALFVSMCLLGSALGFDSRPADLPKFDAKASIAVVKEVAEVADLKPVADARFSEAGKTLLAFVGPVNPYMVGDPCYALWANWNMAVQDELAGEASLSSARAILATRLTAKNNALTARDAAQVTYDNAVTQYNNYPTEYNNYLKFQAYCLLVNAQMAYDTAYNSWYQQNEIVEYLEAAQLILEATVTSTNNAMALAGCYLQ